MPMKLVIRHKDIESYHFHCWTIVSMISLARINNSKTGFDLFHFSKSNSCKEWVSGLSCIHKTGSKEAALLVLFCFNFLTSSTLRRVEWRLRKPVHTVYHTPSMKGSPTPPIKQYKHILEPILLSHHNISHTSHNTFALHGNILPKRADISWALFIYQISPSIIRSSSC